MVDVDETDVRLWCCDEILFDQHMQQRPYNRDLHWHLIESDTKVRDGTRVSECPLPTVLIALFTALRTDVFSTLAIVLLIALLVCD